MRRLTSAAFVLLFCFCGCARQDSRNTDCQWPREPNARSTAAERQRQLSSDAQLAEDLAIRYADAHKGIHSGHFEGWAAYGQARDRCMDSLFGIVATRDGVTPSEVRESLAERPLLFDLAVMLSFAVFYFLLANLAARQVWRRFPAPDGWGPGIAAIFAASVVASAVGVALGEVWCEIAESIRVGNGHLSYRVDRIPWNHHHLLFFLTGIVLFWFAAVLQCGRRQMERPLLSL